MVLTVYFLLGGCGSGGTVESGRPLTRTTMVRSSTLLVRVQQSVLGQDTYMCVTTLGGQESIILTTTTKSGTAAGVGRNFRSHPSVARGLL